MRATVGARAAVDDFTEGVWGLGGLRNCEDPAEAKVAVPRGKLPLTFCSANSALYNEKWNSRPEGGGMGVEEAKKVSRHLGAGYATGVTMERDGDIGGMKWKGLCADAAVQRGLPAVPEVGERAWFTGGVRRAR